MSRPEATRIVRCQTTIASMTLRLSWFSIGLALLMSVALPAQTQEKSPLSSDRSSLAQSQPAVIATDADNHKIGPLDISGSWRVRAEGWDWFDPGSGENAYGLVHSLLRVAIAQKRSFFDWQIEAAQDTILAMPANAILPAPQGQMGLGATYFASNGNNRNSANGFLRQAFVRFKPGQTSIQLGRFVFLDGSETKPKDPTLSMLKQTRIAQRVIGDFGWSAVGRSYDGALVSANIGKNNLTIVVARPTEGVFQTSAMEELNIDLFYGAFTMPVSRSHGAAELRIFGIGYLDQRNNVLKTDNRPQSVRAADHGAIQIGTYGAHYHQVFDTKASGKFDVVLWGAIQSGTWGALSQRAVGFVTEAGWQPPVNHLKPMASFGFSYGSGDGDPNDSRHGTFFQILPTPRPYARFPFYNMQNNEDSYIALNIHPHSKILLRSEFHNLRLANRNDLWYLGGGAFQPQTFGYTGRPSAGNQNLANVLDVSADYQLTQNFSITGYYGHAWGGAVIAAIYAKNYSGQLAYVETNLRF